MKRFLLILLIFSMMSPAAFTRERIALVIGNNDYQVSPLPNPVYDARDMAKALGELGFEVTLKVNADQMTMESAIQAFGKKLRKNAVGLFYFSGHGVQYQGENYLIPINSIREISTADFLRYKAVPAGLALAVMQGAGNGLNLIILDACRDNPFKGFAKSLGQGLTRMGGARGTLIAYATTPGTVAWSGEVGERNSLYTKHLLWFMKQPNLTIESMLKQVRKAVMQETQHEIIQMPWYEASISDDFYFVKKIPDEQHNDLLPTVQPAEIFEVDDNLPPSNSKRKGLTVEVPVAKYYPTDTQSALYRVLQQAQILTANVSFMGNDGVPYEQHSWNAGSDVANLKRGIDCSRAIWFAFTRADVPYNLKNRYLATFQMWQEDSDMKHYFRRCSVENLRLGDVLVYRSDDEGHTVMVLDPKKKLAWGSHGWDGSGRKDTGVEVQQVALANWRYWDNYRMKLKACWRHQEFTGKKSVIQPLPPSKLSQYPETRIRSLSHADLKDKTRYALWIMRNEMFARYGYRFKNQELAAYFQSQPWYQPTYNDSETIFQYQFSDLERVNVKLIYQYEQNQHEQNQYKQNQIASNPKLVVGDYPETATRRLTYADIAGKSKSELCLMRNEIYARHGYRFKRFDLQIHFENKSWYQPKTTDDTDLYNNHFTPIERDNVNFIWEHE